VLVTPLNRSALIEQYFINQYSLQQRSAILTALAMGAREAAGLPTIAPATTASVDWPTKRLPPALHERYVSPADVNARQLLAPPRRGPVEIAAGELSSMAIERSREDAESKLVEFQRETSVRVKRFSRRPAEAVPSAAAVPTAAELGIEAYTDVAANFFILPLIGRFWLHYEEEDLKAARSASRYTSTGAGMILSALALSKLLATMSVLVHAARHSTLFLTAIAPETLRLAVTTAGRAAAARPAGGSSMDDGEVSVLAAALELAVVVLDASRDLDGGRTLIIDHAGLLLGIAEWGQLVFEQTERGERVLGEGGEDTGRVRRSSAGLCVLVAEIRGRWGS
jgi:telomere length regulation protein